MTYIVNFTGFITAKNTEGFFFQQGREKKAGGDFCDSNK